MAKVGRRAPERLFYTASPFCGESPNNRASWPKGAGKKTRSCTHKSEWCNSHADVRPPNSGVKADMPVGPRRANRRTLNELLFGRALTSEADIADVTSHVSLGLVPGLPARRARPILIWNLGIYTSPSKWFMSEKGRQ